MGDRCLQFQLQWLELKTIGEVEKWVSQLGRSLIPTRGRVVEGGLRRLVQRLKVGLLMGQLVD